MLLRRQVHRWHAHCTINLTRSCSGPKHDILRMITAHHHNIHYHLRPKSSGRVTHDAHKLQTKAIKHLTRHYMNCRELQSDQPIHVPLLHVQSFPPSDSISALARRRAPHLATTRKDNASCNILFTFCTAIRIQRLLVIARTAIASIKPFKWRPVCEAVQIAVRHEAHTLCGGD